jgi:threonyl-tRNA synthetase
VTTASVLAGAGPDTAAAFFVVTPDDVTPLGLLPDSGLSPGMQSVVEQETTGRRVERTPPRLAQLLRTFGFEWEPLSEPGHMRYLGSASFMFDRAREHAAATAASVLAHLGVPAMPVSGVSVIDPSAPALGAYLRLTANEPLYGDTPYEVRGSGQPYMLRQTSCLQKYAVCLGQNLPSKTLPIALSEISDSFRREPEHTLQIGYRLRRFHLPETHIHTAGRDAATELSNGVHAGILDRVAELGAEVVLLISATHEFAAAHHSYFRRLTEQAGSSALLKVSPPGQICQDGIEVDVEYKIVDSQGCCRELSTFQIDTQITRSMGIGSSDDTPVATMHCVFTGGIERYLYTVLDGIVRSEQEGCRRAMPLWLSPVTARVIPQSADAHDDAQRTAQFLGLAGARVEYDDRVVALDAAIADADASLIPHAVLVTAAEAGGEAFVRVRDYASQAITSPDLRDLAQELGAAAALRPSRLVERTSQQVTSIVRRPTLEGVQ